MELGLEIPFLARVVIGCWFGGGSMAGGAEDVGGFGCEEEEWLLFSGLELFGWAEGKGVWVVVFVGYVWAWVDRFWAWVLVFGCWASDVWLVVEFSVTGIEEGETGDTGGDGD